MTRKRALELAWQLASMIPSPTPHKCSVVDRIITDAILAAVAEEQTGIWDTIEACVTIDAAVRAEREACAKIAERDTYIEAIGVADRIADAIRERGIHLKVGV